MQTTPNPPPTPQTANASPSIARATPGFASWLFQQSLSIFISTYQHNRLLILSALSRQELSLAAHPFDRPMGIAVSPSTLRLATRRHLWEFQNVADPSEKNLFQLQSVTPTGYLDAHDLITAENDAPILVDTLHSCLRRIEHRAPPEPIWHPPFISKLSPEDRCHLNGLAAEGIAPRYATAVSPSNEAEGWRQNRRNGGMLIDVANNEIILNNLSMPHSPRLHRNRLWLLNAGAGQLGYANPTNSLFQPIAFCPGFLRGLAFHNQFAIVGLSQTRRNQTFNNLPLANEWKHRNQQPFCGLAVVNIQTCEIPFTLQFAKPLAELFDVQLLHASRQPTLLYPATHQNLH